jgi:hypothetical protein
MSSEDHSDPELDVNDRSDEDLGEEEDMIGAIDPSAGFTSALQTLLSKEHEKVIEEEEAPILPGISEVDIHTKEEKKKRQQLKKNKYQKQLLLSKGHVELTDENEDLAEELRLKRLATQGIVKLFNTVREHQVKATAELTRIKNKNPLRAAQLSKEKFLQILEKEKERDKNANNKRKIPPSSQPPSKIPKTAEKKWNVLSDNYLLTTKSIKDLEAESSSSVEESSQEDT